MRKMLSCLTLVCVIAIIASSVAIASDEEPQPSILIEEMRHDMGEVYEQENYKYAFKVKNVGKADLVIDSVKPG